VRHDLVPTLARDFNPNVVEVLARTAEVAQGEEEFWNAELERLMPLVLLPGKPTRGGGRRSSAQDESIAFNLEALNNQPVAVQRRLLLAALRRVQVEADVVHVEHLIELLRGKTKAVELPGNWRAKRSFRELWIEPTEATATFEEKGYSQPLPVPGEVLVEVPGMRLLVQARLEPLEAESQRYNPGQVTDELHLHESSLVLRNWQAGDRFQPGQSKVEKKVKEILQQLKVPAEQRPTWPVVAAAEQVIWVWGARPRPLLLEQDGKYEKLTIEARKQGN
jgi:tRNA(Ile)-lysidine synthase